MPPTEPTKSAAELLREVAAADPEGHKQRLARGYGVGPMPQADAQLPNEAHARCVVAGQHICQVPSGRTCIEQGCDESAGTWWGPLWCPPHDKERLDRISASFEQIARSFDATG